jgi:hypothetical protein
MSTETFIRPFIQVIALAEEGWNIEKKHKKYIDKILTVYFFNQNEETYCCEITPSYELNHFEYQVRFNAAGEKLSDEQKDAIRDVYEQIYVEETVTYMHTATVDKFIKWVADEKLEFRHHEFGDLNSDLSNADLAEILGENDWRDIVRESIQSNCVL